MPDITAVEIPKPLNWQDFQKACIPLFRNLVGDQHLQEFGREGQAQQGIDLLGCRDGNPAKPVGIQCRRVEEPITDAALRKEAAKAKASQPKLTELIFATTSDRDAKIQAAAAKLTQELHDEGWACRVIVMGWHDLRLEIVKYPDALDAFLPSGRILQQPIIDAVRHEGASTRAALDEQKALLLQEIRESLSKSQGVVREDYDADLAPEAKSEPAGLHARISAYREFIQKGQTKIALGKLQKLLEQDPPLPTYARYRVLANIAAVHVNAGRYAAALDFSRQAHALRPTDPKAQTNLAFAELTTGDREGAARRAMAILAEHPDHSPAASALLQARSTDKSVSDPFALVPKGTHDSAEFMIAVIVFLRQRDDASWRELAAKAAAAHADSAILKRFAAEAELEPVLADPELMLGKKADGDLFEKVKRCATTLKEIWAKEIAAEEVAGDEVTPLASNLASAFRCAGDDKAAAEVLDATIAKVGKDPTLVRARALLHLHADEDGKAIALLTEQDKEPEIRLFAAQLLALKQPDQAQEQLNGIDAAELPTNLKHVVPEVRAEIAFAKGDADLLRAALDELDAGDGPFAVRAMLRARGMERGLLQAGAEQGADEQTGKEDDDDLEDLSEDERLPRQVVDLIKQVHDNEAKLTFADRVLIAQYLDNHNAFEAASALLHERVAFNRDTVGLRTYLSASIGAHLAARVQKVLDALPKDVAPIPFFQRLAAMHYWNTGDVKSAAPLIKGVYKASPRRLDLFLWHFDALVRTGQQKKIHDLLTPAVEDSLDGNVAQKARLAAALASFGQPERALRLAYREFALNRNSSSAWMGFMSVMLTGGKSDDMNLLSAVIGEDHTFEVKFDDGIARRYLIESDEAVRKVEPDALSPDHQIALAVQGKQPGDGVAWPIGGGEATITNAKHKYLEAFHAAMTRFNERFPAAKGFKQVRLKAEGDDAFAELKAELVARSEYVIAQTKQYADGKLSLSMLAFMTGVDPIDVMIGLTEVGNPYRVSVGIKPERMDAFKAIADNKQAGCVVDAATYHCIRRLELEDVVTAVCGRIGITQATADMYQVRLQNLDMLGKGEGGSMGYRDGKFYLNERSAEEREKTRAVIDSDIQWLQNNADVLPARPLNDPPPVFRRLGTANGARFFDDVYAASGSGRMLLIDDLFTRQVAGQLGTAGTPLQPVLMLARNRGLLSPERYAKAVTDLIELGQDFISIDAATLRTARNLDRKNGEPGVGRRLKAATRPLGGKNADPSSHCGVVSEFLNSLWTSRVPTLDDYAVTSHVLRELLKGRNGDYQAMLTYLDQQFGHNRTFRVYLRHWARGHFLGWPAPVSPSQT